MLLWTHASSGLHPACNRCSPAACSQPAVHSDHQKSPDGCAVGQVSQLLVLLDGKPTIKPSDTCGRGLRSASLHCPWSNHGQSFRTRNERSIVPRGGSHSRSKSQPSCCPPLVRRILSHILAPIPSRSDREPHETHNNPHK